MSEHRFFCKPDKEQRLILAKIVGCSILINIPFLVVGFWTQLYFLPVVSIAMSLSVVAPFFDVPSMVKSGKLKYYSAFFLVEKPKQRILNVHGGTLLDYTFMIDRRIKGNQRVNQILAGYVEGLLNLLDEFDKEEQMKLRGTSYFLNERTASKLGFSKVKTSPIQAFILAFNYVNLIISYSLAKGRLMLPNLRNIRTYEADLEDLRAKKEYMKVLRRKLG